MKQAKASDKEVETLIRWLQRMEETDRRPPAWARVVFGYQVLVNNACDPAKDYLDWKPGESPTEIAALRGDRDQWRACAEKLAESLNQPARRPRHSGLCCKVGPDGGFLADAAGKLVIECACGDCAKQAFAAIAEFERLQKETP